MVAVVRHPKRREKCPGTQQKPQPLFASEIRATESAQMMKIQTLTEVMETMLFTIGGSSFPSFINNDSSTHTHTSLPKGQPKIVHTKSFVTRNGEKVLEQLPVKKTTRLAFCYGTHKTHWIL